jgi:nucleotide-binding universal stress UspA family protein
MKTILAGTDFSKSSANAARYAAMLAQKSGARLLLFNMYEIPLIHSNSGLYFMSYTPQRDESETRMMSFIKKLKKEFPDVTIDSFVSTGFFRQEIESLVKRRHIRAVVMGMSAKDRFSKAIYGSHATDIAGKIKAPVLIVPDKFNRHHLHKILLGVESKGKLHKASLRKLEEFAREYKLAIELLHVHTENEIFADESKASLKIAGRETVIEEAQAKTIEEGIERTARRKKADLIAIISKKHSVFFNLFKESLTKQIAFTTDMPVLAIHE